MRRAALVLTLAIVAGACVSDSAPESGARSPSPSAATGDPTPATKRRCGLHPEQLLRVWRGYHPKRSGEIQIVPRQPNFIGSWLSHSGPWDYVQRVPLLLYGPGHVPAVGRVERPVTVADVAPTLAEYLRFDFRAPDGDPLREALPPEGDRPPKLILTLVWDTVGRNVLAEHPEQWPTLRGLIPEGAWFERAVVGSSPSVTPAVHTTIGTGSFPYRHGLIDLRAQIGDELREREQIGPQILLRPSLADLYDRAMDNEPRVGLIGPEGALGILGHGSGFEGGDEDLASIVKVGEWIPSPGSPDWFSFPSYAPGVPGLERAARRLDRADGEADGLWMGEDTLGTPGGISQTPAFAEYQTDVVTEILRREGFGKDDVPDLLFVNYRHTDAIGHIWSMNGPFMEQGLRSSDDELAALIEILDREVGEGEWVIALTADHGSTPKPEVTGAFVADPKEIEADLEAAFGGAERVVRNVRVTQIWMDEEQLRAYGHSLADVAAFLRGYTKGQQEDGLPEDEADDRFFTAVVPGRALESGACRPKPGA